MSVKYANTSGVKQLNPGATTWTDIHGNPTSAPGHGILDKIGAVAPFAIMAGMGYGALSDAGVIGAGAATGGGATTGSAGASMFGIPAKDIFSAGTSLFGQLFGAHEQVKGADKAAQLQADGNAAALAFMRAQAENAYQNSEVTRRANYDQWAARERRLGSIGDALGWTARPVTEYAPGVDPNFGGAPSGSPASAPVAAPPSRTVTTAPVNRPMAMPSINQALQPHMLSVSPTPVGVDASPYDLSSIEAMLNARYGADPRVY